MDSAELIIFDCDGVLIDSEPLASGTLACALQLAGISITAAESHRVFTGSAESEIRRICAETYGLTNIDAVFAHWRAELYAEFSVSLKPMVGMPELVSRLSITKCVASNSSYDRLEASLGKTDMWRCFAPHIFSAQSVARPKPAPDLLLHCAESLAVPPSRCIMIDDSPHGIVSAQSAGIVAIGFVDESDPRPDRAETLAAAGAQHVAVGAGDLGEILNFLIPEGGVSAAKMEAVYHG